MKTIFVKYDFEEDVDRGLERHKRKKEAIKERAEELIEEHEEGKLGHKEGEILIEIAGYDQPDLLLSQIKDELQEILKEADVPISSVGE